MRKNIVLRRVVLQLLPVAIVLLVGVSNPLEARSSKAGFWSEPWGWFVNLLSRGDNGWCIDPNGAGFVACDSVVRATAAEGEPGPVYPNGGGCIDPDGRLVPCQQTTTAPTPR